VIAGRIVPLDSGDPDAIFKGRIYIDDNGTIDTVSADGKPAPSGFERARLVNLGDAFVMPGLIDLHNHIGYNALPLWTEPRQNEPFAHHDSWTRAASYQSSVSWPANALVQAAPEALLAYVQLRALVGGTTAIQGWPMANRDFGQALRNVDSETAGTRDRNRVYTSALTKKSLELAKMAQAINAGAGFIYHCAEGQVGSLAAREFIDVANAGCLARTFIGVHCNAVAAADWQRWDTRKAGAIVWSPFSNLWLYGTTTDIASAQARGVSVCLGSDWGPSGTKNVQCELKVARLVSQHLGLGLTDRALVATVTTNPGDVLTRCWGRTIGRLVPGAFADITAFHPNGTASVWTQIVQSTEREVALVVSDGIPRYGDAALVKAALRGPSAPITIAGRSRRFAVPAGPEPGRVWSWRGITRALDVVRTNPAAALRKARGRRRAYAGPADAPSAPLELVLDMPTGERPIAGDLADHASEIVIPPRPSLVHDAPYFKAIARHGFHGKVLDGLKEFYE
jgi:cytosine/adenosine deaminase-related metal-dependent hydrolase